MKHGWNTEMIRVQSVFHPRLSFCLSSLVSHLAGLPFWQSGGVLGVGRFLRCVGTVALFDRWGTSPAVAISLVYTTVYTTSHQGYCAALCTKGLGRISRRPPLAACHFLYVNNSVQ
jgi:hypothetical protein